ncbi:hypothetical protein Tco_1157485, partial [Tanacetum coccineum]
KYDTYALADTGSNINVLPYGVYMIIGRGEVEPIANKIKLLDHSKAEPMGILRDVLCQFGVTTILASGGIINTIKGTTSTFDGVCHQKFPIDAIKIKPKEKNSDDEEELVEKRDENGTPIYDLDFSKDLERSLQVPLQHNEWMPSYADNSKRKVEGDGAWHLKCSIVDPYGNKYNQG